jgi:hypothetical protein
MRVIDATVRSEIEDPLAAGLGARPPGDRAEHGGQFQCQSRVIPNAVSIGHRSIRSGTRGRVANGGSIRTEGEM